MEDYNRPTSVKKERPADLKVGKVVAGQATPKKQGELSKFFNSFVSHDVENIKSYLIADVLIPAIKRAGYDLVVNFAEIFFNVRAGASGKSGVNASKVSYNNISKVVDRSADVRPNRTGFGFSYDQILYSTVKDANEVLDGLQDLISQYGFARVADMYDLSDYQTTNFTMNDYGWMDISGSMPVPVRGGYILKLPRPSPIN